jgi:hypothetical protein
MNGRTILTGLIGGILLSIALEYPLHTYLPSTVVAGWPSASIGWTILLIVVALFLVVGTGALGALVSGAGGRLGAAAAGAFAGMIAAMIAEIWVCGPAAGIWGSRAILAYGMKPAADNSQFLQLMLDATTQTAWWTFISVWLALISGAVLGSVGGTLLGRGRISGAPPTQVWPPILLLGTLCSAAATIFTLNVFSILGPTLIKTAASIQYSLPYPDWVILYCPSVSSWSFLIIWQIAGFLAVRQALADSPADHAVLGILAWLFGWLPFLTVLAALVFTGGAFLGSPLLAVILPSLAVGLLTMLAGWRIRPTPPASEGLRGPGLRNLIAIALLSGLATVFAINLGVLAYAVNVSALAIPMIIHLDPAASTGTIQTASSGLTSMSDLANGNYMLNRTLSLIILPVSLGLGVLTAAAFWLLRRKIQDSGATSLRTRIIRGGVSLLILTALIFLITVAGFILPVYVQSVLPGL